MEKIKYYLDKYKIVIILIMLILALIGSILYVIFRPEKKTQVNKVEIFELKEETNYNDDIIEPIKVDIKGYVSNPGVYEMDSKDRVIDVIEKAGGLIDNANTEYINLSKKIIDEMIIIIYSNDQVEKFKEEEKETIYLSYECVCPDNLNDVCISKEDVVNTNGTKEEGKVEEPENLENNSKDNLISINTATLEELMTLDGIGESKAKAIIEYREENGGFKNLEEIMNVSGIGENAYSKIKNNIKL